ncbi:putative death-receptor fusion protein-domain-containing protein [Protomyces lactucae-debilis]|uniref:Putative death-receptor fusion protein-domain-containing protein n=1 Tax=Protomyces lactucae-debilis TaxID=2754530 RepID=A0A1Y2FVG7_PROLT|nr:putative death-receptor fusion protein-domain-containing protein [Protomyces lactucae-debilis]ORY87978.1 putative death-receptor fusion protein-domain-containing protein [Protomyces lactucae-debilis]
MALKQSLGKGSQEELLALQDGQSLLSSLLRRIMKYTATDDYHVSVQIAFMDLLATWLSKATKLAKLDETCKPELRQTMKDFWRPIFDLFFRRTTISSATVSVGKDVLLKALQLQSALYELGSVQERLEYLVQSILEMSSSDKAVYLALEVIQKQASLTIITQLQPGFVAERLPHMNDDTLSTSLGRLIGHILRSQLPNAASDDTQIAWVASWQRPLVEALRNEDDLVVRNIYQYILPAVFRGLLPAFKHFLVLLNEPDHQNLSNQRLMIASLRMAKNEHLIPEADAATLSLLGLEEKIIQKNITHADVSLRVATLGLVVEHPKPTTFYTNETLDILEKYLPGFFLETDSFYRKEVLDSWRMLLGRLQASLYYTKTAIRKAKLKDQDLTPINSYIQRCKAFTTWLLDLLKHNLRPGAGFQLVTVSLQVIQIASGLGWSPAGMPAIVSKYAAFKKSMTHNTETTMALPFDVNLFDREMVRLIIDRLGDSFDDNRTLAIGLLESLPEPIEGLSSFEEVNNLLHNAKTLLLSTRGRDGDGGARVMQFVFLKFVQSQQPGNGVLSTTPTAFVEEILRGIDTDATRAQKDLLLMAQTAPLHGRLIALGYIVSLVRLGSMHRTEQQAWLGVFDELLKLCKTVWSTVKEVLCTNSPEGFLPSSVQDRIHGPYRGPETQVILSFCWRALKECSNLLQRVTAVQFQLQGASVPIKYVEATGDLFLAWMCEIRHRGAFTAAASDFVFLCERLEQSSIDHLRSLPSKWLQTNLGHLSASMHSKDITRRSGGLPMSIVSALVAEASSSTRTVLFQRAVDDLVTLASSPVDHAIEKDDTMELPQVHALNTLKYIFNESKLSSRTVSCIERIFVVAMQGFNSTIWDIRNCSLMLFNAVLHRSFRSKKPRTESLMQTFTTEAFFQAYPGLLSIVNETLADSVDKLLQAGHASVTTALYPILTLLSHLDVSESSDRWDNMSKTMQLVDACSTSEIWQIRAIAAKALPTFIERSEVAAFVVSSLNKVDIAQQNHLHGKLLQTHALFAYHLARTRDPGFLNQLYGDVTRALVSHFVTLTSDNRSAITRAHLLQIHIDFFTHNSLVDISPMIVRLKQMAVDFSFRSLFKIKSESRTPVLGQGVLDRVMTLVVMQALAEKGFKQFGDMSSGTIVKRLFEHESDDVRLTAYAAFPGTFAGTAMLRSPVVAEALTLQSVKETWSQTVITARTCLATLPISSNASVDHESSHLVQRQFERFCGDIERSGNASPLVDASLVLVGRLIQKMPKTAIDVQRYRCMLDRFSDEYMPLESRRAVVRSLESSGLLKLFMSKQNSLLQHEYASVLPIVLDSLSDDDDELREEAAALVSQLLPESSPMRPEEARSCLLRYCMELHMNSPTIHHILAVFATGLPRSLLSEAKPASSTLVRKLIEQQVNAALEPSDLLFAVERQNLWRDPVEDCRVALQALSTAGKLDASAAQLLARFSKSGLSVLDACMTKCGVDGALGWCSDADLFSLFNRVLQCTRFALSSLSVEEDRKMMIEECLYTLNHGASGKRSRVEQTRLHESLGKIIAEYA